MADAGLKISTAALALTFAVMLAANVNRRIVLSEKHNSVV